MSRLYRFSVEWHMQLMHWLLAKLASTDFSKALWYEAATAEPPPSVLPDRPTPAWQSTLTPVMPAQHCKPGKITTGTITC